MSANAKRKADALAKQQADLAKINELGNNTNSVPDDTKEDIFDILSGFTKGIDEVDEFQGVTPISTIADFIEDDGYIAFDSNNFSRAEKALMVDLFNIKRSIKLRVFCSVALSADVRAGIKTDDDLIHFQFGEKTTKDGNKTLVLMNERGQQVRSNATNKTKPKDKPKLSFEDLMKGSI